MDKKFTFELTEADVNVILSALAEGPFKVVQPVIAILVNSFNAQNPRAEAVTDVEAK